MAKPIEFITELNRAETVEFLRGLQSGEGAAEREKTARAAKKLGNLLGIEV